MAFPVLPVSVAQARFIPLLGKVAAIVEIKDHSLLEG